jgi:hypothetical protein
MKKILLFLLIFSAVSVFSCNNSSQDPQKDVQAAVDSFVKGIVDADGALLESISADKLTFGHSSGKVQNKAEFIEEIVSKIPNDYTSVNLSDQTITISGDAAVVRHIYSADYTSNDTIQGSVRIGNVLIWQNQDGKWMLLARQAFRL